MPPRKSPHRPRPPAAPPQTYELEVLPGLEPYARAELAEVKGARPLEPDSLRFSYAGDLGGV